MKADSTMSKLKINQLTASSLTRRMFMAAMNQTLVS